MKLEFLVTKICFFYSNYIFIAPSNSFLYLKPESLLRSAFPQKQSSFKVLYNTNTKSFCTKGESPSWFPVQLLSLYCPVLCCPKVQGTTTILNYCITPALSFVHTCYLLPQFTEEYLDHSFLYLPISDIFIHYFSINGYVPQNALE